nr:MAG TPA: hypothetical protein [Caudoviricetes sp.]
MWNMHNWDSATADAYRLTVVARTAAFSTTMTYIVV